MIVGYARTSTTDQVAGLDAQVRDLTAAGCERIWQEHVSSVAERPELAAGLDFVREGDTFVVTKFDRLARSVTDLGGIVERLHRKGVSLRVLGALGLDTGTASGKLMMQVLSAVAEFERAIMLERQREGIAAAKAAGKYKGRKPTCPSLARVKSRYIVKVVDIVDGKISVRAVTINSDGILWLS
jgi:DNA invertase Pin-like site-specific DNA recombinase